jgi:hypothetical protein
MLITSPSLAENTPAVRMPYVVQTHELTQIGGIQTFDVRRSDAVTADGLALQWKIDRDITGTPRADPTTAGPGPSMPESQDDRGLRLRLLAAKYGRSRFSREDEARLGILTARLRNVMTRVSEDDVVALEAASQKLEASRQLRKTLSQKYGV